MDSATWDSLRKSGKAKSVLKSVKLSPALTQLKWSSLTGGDRKKIERVSKGKGWYEERKPIVTRKGIQKKAPVHRKVAVKKSLEKTLRKPLEKEKVEIGIVERKAVKPKRCKHERTERVDTELSGGEIYQAIKCKDCGKELGHTVHDPTAAAYVEKERKDDKTEQPYPYKPFKEAQKMPKGGAVEGDEDNLQAWAAESIARRFGLNPEAVYNWGQKHKIILKNIFNKEALGDGTNLIEAVLNDTPLGMPRKEEEKEKEKEKKSEPEPQPHRTHEEVTKSLEALEATLARQKVQEEEEKDELERKSKTWREAQKLPRKPHGKVPEIEIINKQRWEKPISGTDRYIDEEGFVVMNLSKEQAESFKKLLNQKIKLTSPELLDVRKAVYGKFEIFTPENVSASKSVEILKLFTKQFGQSSSRKKTQQTQHKKDENKQLAIPKPLKVQYRRKGSKGEEYSEPIEIPIEDIEKTVETHKKEEEAIEKLKGDLVQLKAWLESSDHRAWVRTKGTMAVKRESDDKYLGRVYYDDNTRYYRLSTKNPNYPLNWTLGAEDIVNESYYEGKQQKKAQEFKTEIIAYIKSIGKDGVTYEGLKDRYQPVWGSEMFQKVWEEYLVMDRLITDQLDAGGDPTGRIIATNN